MTAGLAATQRWMGAAVTGEAPLGADGADVVSGSERLPAWRRVEFYRHSYRQRLIGCLRRTYPALRHALGEELFDDFALDHLAANPPSGPRLASFAAGFPRHLDATRPEGERWPDFVVDLARLELAFCEVYDGPGTEGMPLPGAADVPVSPPAGATAVVVGASCARVLRATYPVGDYLLAVRRGEAPALPAPRPCAAVLGRREWTVTLTTLDVPAGDLLARLLDGAGLRSAAVASGVDHDDAWRLLRGWADGGTFTEVRITNGESR